LLYVGPPDARGREEILKIRLAKMSVEPGLDVTSLAALVSTRCFHRSCALIDSGQTEGCSGAEIVSMCQEAALLTMKEDMGAEYVCPFFPATFIALRCYTGLESGLYDCGTGD
jgi:AAA family ATPase